MRYLWLMALMLLVPGARAEIAWQSDFDAARAQAARLGRPLFVDFFATWCAPCRAMEQTAFRDARVVRLLERCVCVKVDIDRSVAIARRYGVNSIPRVMVLSAKGKTLLDQIGYDPSAPFADTLARALSGKTAGIGTPNGKLAGVAALEAAAESGKYAAWKAAHPAEAAKARSTVVEQLASFDETTRTRAKTVLAHLGDDAVDSLIAALAHPKLAVRAAAYDALGRLLANQYRLTPATQPHYDAWAPSLARAQMKREWAIWWAQRRKQPAVGT